MKHLKIWNPSSNVLSVEVDQEVPVDHQGDKGVFQEVHSMSARLETKRRRIRKDQEAHHPVHREADPIVDQRVDREAGLRVHHLEVRKAVPPADREVVPTKEPMRQNSSLMKKI